jgi:CheY-like chemotaxis protein
MLVDDTHDDLFILKRILSRSGVLNPFISFDHASEAQRFLQAALSSPETKLLPAAIFCDKSMPEYNGFDLLAWVRSEARLAMTPFFLLTSLVHRNDEMEAARWGATAFFEKFPSQHIFAERLAGIPTVQLSPDLK